MWKVEWWYMVEMKCKEENRNWLNNMAHSQFLKRMMTGYSTYTKPSNSEDEGNYSNSSVFVDAVIPSRRRAKNDRTYDIL